ncbi:hypothetical protein JYK14_14910 [Siccirubricoccus sp. KC 17139]|uniref:Uncharacterized protein n=1 Tax=Siccirubricoccus soli TaxID=2899147 RepID=A0ABT1D699_9PROT|nr:hypothetical protein [Siccirubricoccus soli]MCO6417442.1 hypothetical protein [Siccirubricoccus soli]MCP2683577.1 hypothetical protein [Siccirubricoccus soli]
MLPQAIPPLPPLLGLTRWEWDGAGIRFRIWARPIIGRGGREVVPVTLLWQQRDGSSGMARCGGFVEAMERALRITEGAG